MVEGDLHQRDGLDQFVGRGQSVADGRGGAVGHGSTVVPRRAAWRKEQRRADRTAQAAADAEHSRHQGEKDERITRTVTHPLRVWDPSSAGASRLPYRGAERAGPFAERLSDLVSSVLLD
ncbi:hypothetical protein GCM10010344_41310 [Streptomyces bluensis]|nr:hypothetical protein GCM10010344_41310 [Streptomyces bluensis]